MSDIFDIEWKSITHLICLVKEDTECILDNYLLCHFHNPQFDRITAQLHSDYYALQNDPDACVKLDYIFGALLPRKNVSCIRQLLDESKYGRKSKGPEKHFFFTEDESNINKKER